jgi:hypothetical protein
MCDTLVALAPATRDGITLFAKNSDRPPTERQVLEWLPARRDGGDLHVTHVTVPAAPADTVPSLICRPSWCWGAEHGVNAAGVAIGNEAIYTRLDPRSAPDALIGMDLVRLGLERAASAGEAINVMTGLLERFGQGGSGHDADRFPHPRPYWSSFLVADPHRAFVLETSGSTWAVEEVEEVRAISNRTTIPTFDAEHRHPRQPVERLVDPRWQASQRVLRERPVTVELLAAHLRSHDTCVDEGWSVCMHVDDVEETTASMIAELDPQGGPHRVLMLLGHPCESEYVEHRIGG